MEASTAKRPYEHSIATAWNAAKHLSNSQKLELVSIIIDSVREQNKPSAPDDEEYSLRPFTMEELNARIDRAEAEIAAGNVVDDDDVWAELDEEFAREDAEEDARQLAAYHEEEQLATV